MVSRFPSPKMLRHNIIRKLLKKLSFPGCSKRAAPSKPWGRFAVQGPGGVFHLPIRQAILRVASRRIRSDFCHADELVSRIKAYLDVRRNDEGPACQSIGRGNAADACLPKPLDLRSLGVGGWHRQGLFSAAYLSSQVRLPHFLIIHQIPAFARKDHRSRLQHISMTCNPQ